MGRPKGSKNKPKGEAREPETVQQQLRLTFTNEKDFKTIDRRVTIAEGAKNEGVSEMGSIISDAVEKKHLDKRAYGIYRRLKRLDDDKLAICLAHLDHYRKIGGLDERASRQAELFEMPGSEDPERDPEPEQEPRGGRRPRVVAGTEAGDNQAA